ncbi:MAG: VanW family protein [Oligoflexales bacterium]|nr:VanW family protein [Oligoflexales bacterium]
MFRTNFLVFLIYAFFVPIFSSCKSTSSVQSSSLSESILNQAAEMVAIDELNYVNIRREPYVRESTLIKYATAFEFALKEENSFTENGQSWHQIILDSKTNETGYIAQIEGVYLIRGYLEIPPELNINIRSNPDTSSNNLIGLISNSSIRLLDIIPKANTNSPYNWFKVLLKGIEKNVVGYIADVSNENAQLKYFSVKEHNDREALKTTSHLDCSLGQAQLGFLKAEQLLFAEPSFLAPTLTIKPKGSRLKIIKPKIDETDSVVNPEFVAVEYLQMHANGFERRNAFVKKNNIQISNKCRPYGPDLVDHYAFTHRSGHNYRSNSAYFRRTNIALGMSRLDGYLINPGTEFSFLADAIFPYEPKRTTSRDITFDTDQFALANLSEDFGSAIDKDDFGCPPGLVFNSKQRRCRAFFDGISTSLQPIYAGGICGISTALHRAAWNTGFPIKKWHNHGKYYPGSYGLADPSYSLPGGEGTEAEVYWTTSNSGGELNYSDSSGYSFTNDSLDSFIILTDTSYSPDTKVTEAYVQFYSAAISDRKVQLSPIEKVDVDRFKWTRKVEYFQKNNLQRYSSSSNIDESISGDRKNILTQSLKSHYRCVYALDQAGKEIIDPETGKNLVTCSPANYNF